MSVSRVKISKKLEKMGFSKERYLDHALLTLIEARMKEQRRQVLREDFLLKQVANYANKSVDDIKKEIRQQRPRREGVNYARPAKARKRLRSARSITHYPPSQTQETKYKYGVAGSITCATPMQKVRKIVDWVSPSSFILSPSGQHATGRRDTMYELHMEGASSALFREVRDVEEIQFDEELLPSLEILQEQYPELFSKPQHFSFNVDKETVIARLGKARGCSQRQVTGYSAKEFFEFLGAEIREQTYGSLYHLAHRHGHALGGAQTGENLDPATAGSNYHTLFRIESPLRELLLDESLAIESVDVSGDIEYHPKLPLPQKITYTLTWGNGKMVSTSIYPLSYDTPTIDDHHMAKAFFRSQKTPHAQRTYSRFFKPEGDSDSPEFPQAPESPQTFKP